MCLAFGVSSLDEVGAKLADVLEMQPPSGLVDKLRGLKQLKSIADSLPSSVRKGACQEIVLQGDEIDLGALPVQTCWPLDAAPFITLPAVITRDPVTGPAERRHVPDAGARPARDRDALAAAQGRPRRLRGSRRADGGRGRARPRPGHRLQRERAAAQAHRRADVRGLPARRGGRRRQGRHRRPRGPRLGRDRPRGLRRAGRPDRRRALRRPHRLLHAGRAVPGLPPHRADDATRRDLPVDRRRQAAGRGRLAREGDRADLPAGDPRLGPRDRRLRPAGRRARSTTARSSRSARPTRRRPRR